MMKSAWKVLAKTKVGTVSTGFYLSLFEIILACSEVVFKSKALFIFPFQLQKCMAIAFAF